MLALGRGGFGAGVSESLSGFSFRVFFLQQELHNAVWI